MLNLDSEEDGALFVGCSGGANCHLQLPITRTPAPAGASCFDLKVAGLKGGHSGLDIHQNRGNALKLLVLALQAMSRAVAKGGLALASLSAGDKPNAIPREAGATLWIDPAGVPKAKEALDGMLQAAQQHYGPVAPELSIALSPSPQPAAGEALDRPSFGRLINLVLALPHGVTTMSRDLLGLVETSSNLATARTTADQVKFVTSSRSSVSAALEEVREQIRACVTLAGGETELRPGYPGWQPNMSSPLLGAAKEVFAAVFGTDAKITAIHAGLECGLIGQRFPDMDMLSFGPEIQNAHSPDERVNIPSTARFWTLLKALLERLAA
jgi:dipeptidase D